MQGNSKHDSEIRRMYSSSKIIMPFLWNLYVSPQNVSSLQKKNKKGGNFKNIAPYPSAPLFLQYAYSHRNLCVHLCIYVDITIHMYVRNVNTRKVRNPKMKIYTNKRWCDDRMDNRGLKKCIMISSIMKTKIEPLSFKKQSNFIQKSI